MEYADPSVAILQLGDVPPLVEDQAGGMELELRAPDLR
jgi:hypothetical protein